MYIHYKPFMLFWCLVDPHKRIILLYCAIKHNILIKDKYHVDNSSSSRNAIRLWSNYVRNEQI